MIFEQQLIEAIKTLTEKVDRLTQEQSELKSLFSSEFATIEEVAQMKGVSKTAIRNKIANGDIDPMNDVRKQGRYTLIRRTAIPKIVVRKSA